MLVTALVILATGAYWLLVPLAYGFWARVLPGPTLSPLGWIAQNIVAPRLGERKPVPGPPKRFAQGMGAVISTLALVLALVVGDHAAADAMLIGNLTTVTTGTGHLAGAGGVGAATGSMKFATAQVGTKTSWTPVKDLTISAEFLYSRIINNLNGTFVTAAGGVPGAAAGTVYTLGSQNVYNGGVQIIRSF